MTIHQSKYLDMPDRAAPTDGLRRGGTGGPAGSELGPALTGYVCSKCGKPVKRVNGSLRMRQVGRQCFHPKGCCE